MSDTPRTDKLINEIRSGVTRNGCIPKDFAKQLERELSAAEKKIEFFRCGIKLRDDELNKLRKKK